ncbi:MAG: two-component sensor histidine kinase, partial [Solirubrobacterales bacterium]|nr:two-component sensor histidine kinase [Solirubrobacterales bacterium]
EQIGESDLTRRIEARGNDDVAQLAHTFNRMLDRLEGAFATQRRFLDDAGHELRTPITVIRGHLEVMGDEPADREATMRLVIGELDRMKRMVDDLVLLAKAQEPDFLHPGEVELAELTVELLAKARVLGDRRWRLAALSEETILADGERLTQALAQLTDNAVAHTREGDLIEVGSAVRDGRVALWVRDDGPGVDDEVRERIFERFARADGATSGEGAGLGLAIVASIAEAHGGRVRLDGAPGQGAKFTLDLPLCQPPRASTGLR